MIQIKKIKNLTETEIAQICNQDCENCPLAIIKRDEIICLKNEMNKEITFGKKCIELCDIGVGDFVKLADWEERFESLYFSKKTYNLFKEKNWLRVTKIDAGDDYLPLKLDYIFWISSDMISEIKKGDSK